MASIGEITFKAIALRFDKGHKADIRSDGNSGQNKLPSQTSRILPYRREKNRRCSLPISSRHFERRPALLSHHPHCHFGRGWNKWSQRAALTDKRAQFSFLSSSKARVGGRGAILHRGHTQHREQELIQTEEGYRREKERQACPAHQSYRKLVHHAGCPSRDHHSLKGDQHQDSLIFQISHCHSYHDLYGEPYHLSNAHLDLVFVSASYPSTSYKYMVIGIRAQISSFIILNAKEHILGSQSKSILNKRTYKNKEILFNNIVFIRKKEIKKKDSQQSTKTYC